jgi:lipopolysaccharide export system protein LptA
MKKNLITACGIAALLLASQAFALKSDKDQPANVDADYSKSVQSRTGAANDPDVYDLDGHVLITRGSIKITSAHGVVHRIPGAANDPNAGQMSRIVLTGNQAHMQQVHDGDCMPMTATADKIDYNPLTNLAELTGRVVIVQQGRGEFHGEHMIYNTDTGDMESGNRADQSGRVHMVMEAKTQATTPPDPNNCGFPIAKPADAKPKDAKPATKPAVDKPADKKPDGEH